MATTRKQFVDGGRELRQDGARIAERVWRLDVAAGDFPASGPRSMVYCVLSVGAISLRGLLLSGTLFGPLKRKRIWITQKLSSRPSPCEVLGGRPKILFV